MATPTRALLVDLNNFAAYPTLAVGYLVATLRGAGVEVDVLSPLSHGLPAVQREHRETAWNQVERRVYFATHQPLLGLHDALHAWRRRRVARLHPRVLEETARALRERPPDVLLLSAYVDHHPSVVALCELAAQRRVPVLLGGPVFNLPEVARAWIGIPGLSAIVGAEVDASLPRLVDDLLAGRDLTAHPGVFLPDGRESRPAPPLRPLTELPVPDFSDFPWDRYAARIIPAMAGRGCSWGRCLFCSDVATANGRTFRTRPLPSVLDELEEQSARHATRDVIFLDIKLNSDVAVWRGIIDGFQDRLPGGRWIGGVHVGAAGDNGLSDDDLRGAYAAGLRRVTFGLESGSQRLNDLMDKGTTVEGTSAFIRSASAAGISVRTTAMLGYPGETPADIDATVAFLEAHERSLDRVRLSRFMAQPGARFQRRYEQAPEAYPGITDFAWDFRLHRARYRYAPATAHRYRAAKSRLLRVVHRINRRPLRDDAVAFDGLM